MYSTFQSKIINFFKKADKAKFEYVKYMSY